MLSLMCLTSSLTACTAPCRPPQPSGLPHLHLIPEACSARGGCCASASSAHTEGLRLGSMTPHESGVRGTAFRCRQAGQHTGPH